VKNSLPTRKLPERPDLGQLRRQAKELLDAFVAGDAGAVAEVNSHYHDVDSAKFSLHDAQLVLARAYGFDSWPKLKAYVDGITVARLADVVRANDLEQVRAILKIRPELVNVPMAWNNEHKALHYAVLGRMPEMVRVLMEHGADPHAGISPRNDATSAITIATERGYDEIVAIIEAEEKRREASPTPQDLVLAELRRALRAGDESAAIGVVKRHPELIHFQMPDNGRTLLHLASALLMPRIVRWLLDHGADVNRQTKDGSTPLDVAGRLCDVSERAKRMPALLRLLRERGAQLTPRSAVILGHADFLRSATPLT
jgi:ankyrin repeat protein